MRVLTLLLLVSAPSAQSLLFDFETTPSTQAIDSLPGLALDLGSQALFTASTPAVGRELFTTDGTTAGTELFLDLVSGFASSSPDQLTLLPNGDVLFVATSPTSGRELWTTDGTAQGTAQLVDLEPGPASSSPIGLTLAGSRVFFFAETTNFGLELWSTDGTPGGTSLADDVIAGPLGIVSGNAASAIARLGSAEVVFTVQSFNWELWRSDGTPGGTSRVTTLPVGFSAQSPTSFTSFGNQVLFQFRPSGQLEPWVTDGTAPGTLALGPTSVSGFTLAGTSAYFENDSSPGGRELFVTDGTPAGTALVFDPTPGVDIGSWPEAIGQVGGELIFSSDDAGGLRRLYRTDGTGPGTVQISTLAPSPTGGVIAATEHLGELWFGTSSLGGLLVRTDGTPSGTTMVAAGIVPSFLSSFGTDVLFLADSDPEGFELWSSSGTPQTTGVLRDLTPPALTQGSFPRLLGDFRSESFYAVEPTGSTEEELWATDGTPLGTRLVAAVDPQTPLGEPTFAKNAERFAFLASDPTFGNELHFSDGTTAGTSVFDFEPGPFGSNGYAVVAFEDDFLFTATVGLGQELYRTDGTIAGTTLIGDLNPGPFSSLPQDFLVHETSQGTQAFFSAVTPGDGREPWVTDGTPVGTQSLGDFLSGPNGQVDVEFIGLGTDVLFAAENPTTGKELWITDGTPGGTNLLADLASGSTSSDPRELRAFGDRIFFLATVNGVEGLWVTDGTTVGTLPFAGLPLPPLCGLQVVSPNRAVLWIGDDVNDELWSLDSTLFQPTLVRAFDPFDLATQTIELARFGENRVVFAANDGELGEELWVTDGTPQGTSLLADFPLRSGQPREMTRAGKSLVFRADDGVNGTELFSVPIEDTGTWVAEELGFGTPGTGGLVPSIGTIGEARGSSPLPFQVTVADALPSSVAFLVWTREPGNAPLTGGTLWLDGTLKFEITTTDALGQGSFSLLVSPGLAGERFVSQWAVLDPLGPVLGLSATSPALDVIVGP